MLLGRRALRRDVLRGVAGELGQVAGVAAQRRRHHERHGQPARPGAVGRELALGDADQEHGVPLQALGPVDGEQLDRVGLRRGRHVEALAELVLGLQPGEQGGQRDLTVDGLELGDGLHEQVEVLAAGRGRGAHRRGQLDVDAGGLDDPADQVEDRLADGGAEPAQLVGQQAEAQQRLLGVVQVAGVLEGVAQRRDLGRVGALDGGLQLGLHGVERLAPGLAAGQLAGPPAEQREVARTDRPARPGQQGEQRGVGGDVLDQGQRGHDLGDLGQPQQALEADDLDRDLPVGERVEDRGGVGVVAGQDADLLPARLVGRGRHRGVRLDHPVGEPGELLVVGLVDDRPHLPGAAPGFASSGSSSGRVA